MFFTKGMIVGACSCWATGCGTEPLTIAEEGDDPFGSPVLAVRDGHLSGQVGDAAVDAAADPLDVFAGRDEISVVAVAAMAEHAVMLQLTVTLDEELFVPGVAEHVHLDQTHRIRLLGCVGQAAGVYDEYDAVADDVVLGVDDAAEGGPGDVTVTATGTWNNPHSLPPSAPRVATAVFTLER